MIDVSTDMMDLFTQILIPTSGFANWVCKLLIPGPGLANSSADW